MAYYRSYGMGPNAQYGYESAFRQGVPNGGTGGDYMSMASDLNQFGMGVQSPYSPPNNSGPGNPGTANSFMPEANAPRFNPGSRTTRPTPLADPERLGYNGSGINPQPYGFGQGGAHLRWALIL